MVCKLKVAAICYRPLTNGAVEFLLVRSTAGDRWTFPKGGIEASDPSPWATAVREAEEEAGVIGEVDSKLLTTYRHLARATRADAGEEHHVAAYLIEVKAVSGKGEVARHPTWMTPEEVIRAFGTNSLPDDYIAEFRRVMDLALKRLHQDDIAAPSVASGPFDVAPAR